MTVSGGLFCSLRADVKDAFGCLIAKRRRYRVRTGLHARVGQLARNEVSYLAARSRDSAAVVVARQLVRRVEDSVIWPRAVHQPDVRVP